MNISIGSVLMTSAARKIPLLRALQAAAARIDPTATIVAGDVDSDAPAKYLAGRFWNMPRLNDLDLNDFICECTDRNIRTILPTRDGELHYWAEARPMLESAGISVIVSPAEGVSLCLDKLAFAQWGEREHLPVIPASKQHDTFQFQTLVVKERYGAGSRSIGIGLSNVDAVRHASGLTDPLFQPFVEGPEISIDAWLTSAGSVHGLSLRRRDRIVGGESQVTTTFRNQALEAQAKHILGKLGLAGPVVMQAIITETGLAIIEVNPRFGGASTASIAIGLDLLYWSLFERFLPDTEIPAFDRRVGEIRQVRIPEDIVIHDHNL